MMSRIAAILSLFGFAGSAPVLARDTPPSARARTLPARPCPGARAAVSRPGRPQGGSMPGSWLTANRFTHDPRVIERAEEKRARKNAARLGTLPLAVAVAS